MTEMRIAGHSGALPAGARDVVEADENFGAARVVVRLARPEEYEVIDPMLEAAYAHDYGPSDGNSDPLRFARARAELFDVWVAIESDAENESAGGGSAILGSVTTSRLGGPGLHEDATPDELDLRLLGVAPAARRRGIAASIMRHVIAHAAATGFEAVVLKTQPRMHGAHRLYEGLGFQRTPKRDGLWIGGEKVLDLLAYRYPLHPSF